MKKAGIALAMLLLILAGTVCASAVELKAGNIRSFDDNILTVTSEEGGILTIEAISGSVPLKNPVQDMPVEAGTVEIPWEGLTYGGEPLQPGRLTLRATLICSDRTVEQTEIRTEVYYPVPAMLCCLPDSQVFYATGRNILKIECAVSNSGTFELSIAPKDAPEQEIWHCRTKADGKAPFVIRWDGKGKNHKLCPPGEYVIKARGVFRPQYEQSAEITILPEPLSEPELAVTGSLIPEDISDDAAVWDALTAPVTIGDGPEGRGLLIMEDKSSRSGRAGTISCRTVGIAILEICEDSWIRVGAWRQSDGAYTEGWVKADKLRTIRPNGRYGAVVDKKTQTMTVYENGRKIGIIPVSTGYTTAESRDADTHSGVYLLGTRMEDFRQYGHAYCYPIRIDGHNLIHSAGYVMNNGERDFEEELAALGTKASHGCIRVDPRTTEENGGINAWWIWTHMGHDTKIIVTPEE